MLSASREFFAQRKILEVDCPLLCRFPSTDAYIDLISAYYRGEERRFLHSSPEYAMKRLLVLGMDDCYQLSHVFRDEELGKLHSPEFMMAEWYRKSYTFENMLKETAEFIELFLGEKSLRVITYREAFKQFLNMDYVTASHEELVASLKEKEFPFHGDLFQESRDCLLNFLLAHVIEPNFRGDSLWGLIHYPISQAAQAKKISYAGVDVSERFEIYFNGIELANGYHELMDAKELRKRFMDANAKRRELDKKEYAFDECFLAAIEKGLPDCCGVAVGFDRLMMLRHQKTCIEDVLPFSWKEA